MNTWIFTFKPFPNKPLFLPVCNTDKQFLFFPTVFSIHENGGKFSERAENAVGKGEIARYEQFLLFQQSFQKTCTAET